MTSPGPKGINKHGERQRDILTGVMRLIPDILKTQEACDKAIEDDPITLALIPNHFKTQEMCIRAMHRESYALLYIPDSFLRGLEGS